MESIESNVDNVVGEINTKLSALSSDKFQEKQEIKILIAEDELTYKPFWKQVIESVRPGARIDWVVSAEAAEKFLLLEYERGFAYDLVILDILLAGEATGVDLWTRFKEAGRSFIFVSKLPIQTYKGTFSKDSPTPICLEKPLDAAQCRKLIGQLIQTKAVKNS
jgi:hypothetical protein